MGSVHMPDYKNEDADERDLRGLIGRRLRHLRKKVGLTMVILGEKAHCSQSFISKVESGSIMPSIPMLYRLAAALGVRPSLLLDEIIQSLGDHTG